MALTASALTLFVLEERSSKRPVVGALRRPSSLAAGAVITSCLSGIGVVTIQSYLPLFIQAGRGEPVIVAGGVLALGSLAWTGGSMLAARLMRHGTRWLVGAGHLSFGVGAGVLLLSISLQAGLVWFYTGYMIVGFGIGLLTPSLFTIALSQTARGSEGTATAGVQVLRALGSGLGAGIAGLVFRLSVLHHLFDLLSSADPTAAIQGGGLTPFLNGALVACWLTAMAFMAVSALVILRLPGVHVDESAVAEITV